MREPAANPVVFDPSNAVHREAYVHFMNTSKWKIRFLVRAPFSSVVNMILYDLSAFACKAEGAIDSSRMTMRADFEVDEDGKYDEHRNLALGEVRVYKRELPLKQKPGSIIPIGIKRKAQATESVQATG